MRNIAWTILIASSLAVGLSAQAPGQQPAQGQPTTREQPATQGEQPAPRAQQPASAQATKTTISGCVLNAPPAAPSAAGAPSTAAKFELANAKMVTAGPVGTAGTASTAVRYRLESDDKLITPHLNHQVEITGTVTPASVTAGATAVPMLKVETVKMVAATCPEVSR